MKKLFSIAFMCCLVAFAATFTSCTDNAEGDLVYKFAPAEELSLSQSADYLAGASIFIAAEMADRADAVKSDGYVFKGKRAECNKRAKAAFEKAIRNIEEDDDYGKVVTLKGIKVRLYYFNLSGKEVDLSVHTFK